ncbi:YpoC family protein [Thalassorhabdus alkalitolerans]|uniref:YpoC family protein n=1 Tax=Thalassorhabdus alkalitolerans TaxID=2282697 RepID=A0ABW0YSW1_9BACI
MNDVPVPDPYCEAPFYSSSVTEVISLSVPIEEGIRKYPFYAEIRSIYRPVDHKPWTEVEKYVSFLLQEWKQEKGKLAALYQERKRAEASPFMVKQLANLISALWWANEKPVPSAKPSILSKESERLHIKPFNIEDRLAFVFEAPDHHASFVQLKEMFDELEKRFKVSLLKTKKSN